MFSTMRLVIKGSESDSWMPYAKSIREPGNLSKVSASGPAPVPPTMRVYRV